MRVSKNLLEDVTAWASIEMIRRNNDKKKLLCLHINIIILCVLHLTIRNNFLQ